jgi:hypothetical protein
MYVNIKSSYQIIKLPDDYLSLVKVNDATLEFQIKYLYDQEQGIKQNITSVNLEISKTAKPNSAVSDGTLGENPANSILTNHASHVEKLTKYANESILKFAKSDPTSAISNEVVHQFSKGYTANQLPQLVKRTLKKVPISAAENEISSKREIQHDIGEYFNDERQIAEAILQMGIDPSDSYSMNELGNTVKEDWEGYNKKSPISLDTKQLDLLYRYKNVGFLKPIYQNSPGEIGTVIESSIKKNTLIQQYDVKNFVEITESIEFDFSEDQSDKLYLRINVVNKNGVPVQILQRTFSPKDFIRINSIPLLPPLAKTSGYAVKNHALLAIKQQSDTATGIKIYKRVIDHYTLEQQNYTFVSEFSLSKSEGWKYIPVSISTGNTSLYRIVAMGKDGSIGSDYQSIVIEPTIRDKSKKYVTMTAIPLSNGVELNINHLPADCVSYQVRKENTTSQKGVKTFVSTPTVVQKYEPNKIYTINDYDVKIGNVYRYYCLLYKKNGSILERLSLTYEHQPLMQNFVETKLVDSKLLSLEQGYDVRFKIQTSVIKNNVDQYKSLLENQGLYELFSSSVENVKEKLGKLLAHNVTRTDLVTGEEENFGTILDEEFSDFKYRKITGVSDLILGRKYRYTVVTLMRAPETMLDSYSRVNKDSRTNRQYKVLPFKFLHPITLSNGSLVSESSLRNHHSKDMMSFGAVGNYTSVDITLDKSTSVVSSATSEIFSSNVDIIRWYINGNSNDIDHFLIITDVDGQRKIGGRMCGLPDKTSYQYIRNVDSYERKEGVSYHIIPVYLDFSRGNSVVVASVSGESA